MARTHTFKGSASAGYGYFAFIEDGQLVIGENWDREGGILYRGTYRDSEKYLNMLRVKAPKLFNGIVQYYSDEATKEVLKKEEAKKEPYYVRYRFKDSRDRHGNGYSGYVNTDGLLIIEQDDPRGGGARFEGKYEEASPALSKLLLELRAHDPVLYNDIDKYFTKHGTDCLKKPTSNTNPAPDMEALKKKLGFDDATKTILFKVKLFMDNREVHNVLVRGRTQSGIIFKLMKGDPEVLTLQTYSGEVFAVRSEKISAIEFLGD